MARSPRRGALASMAALLFILAFATEASAATYAVDTTNDTPDADTSVAACADADGKCSLRAAFDQANENEGADVVTLPAGRYVIGESLFVDNDQEVTLNGAGVRDTIVDSNGNDRAFEVDEDASLDASGLTVTGGHPCDCISGGAFLVGPGGTLFLTDARLTRNQVPDSEDFDPFTGAGGAIFSFLGTVELTRVRLDHNSAANAGGAIASIGGELDIVDSQIEANSTVGVGGAVAHLRLLRLSAGLRRGPSSLTNLISVAPGNLHDLGEHAERQRRRRLRRRYLPRAGLGVELAHERHEREARSDASTIVNSTISGNTAGATRTVSSRARLSAVASTPTATESSSW